MATVRPFRGLRYSDQAGSIADLVAPPYDVISPSEREEYASKNSHNVVNLTLPVQNDDDRSKFVKYARSAAQLEEWRRSGVLELEPAPSFYRYTQTFKVPGIEQKFTRTSLFVLLKVEPYSQGIVLPHEQTFPKHKEDRLRILEATKCHLESIFGLYEDEDNGIHSLIAQASGKLVSEFVTVEDDIHHKLEIIDDCPNVHAIENALSSKRLWIADGHHRYETALNFRAQQGENSELIPEDFMMMAIDSMTDPGLVLLPTHRILKSLPCTSEELKLKMTDDFEIQDCNNSELMSTIESIQTLGFRAFGVALPGGKGFIARVRNHNQLAEKCSGDGSPLLKELDVSILHGYIFEKLLGLTGLDFFGYTRIEQEAVDSVENGAPAAFLMNPPTVNDMRLIALNGEKMPQKSTYYHPKLMSGLVMWSLKDF